MFLGEVSACKIQSPRGDESGISRGPNTSLTVSQLLASMGFAFVTVSLEIVTTIITFGLS